MSQFVVGRRPGATFGERDVVFDVQIIRWIFVDFNEKHQITELRVVHQRKKVQGNKTRYVVKGIFI